MKFKNKSSFENNSLKLLKKYNIDILCLAGFMKILSGNFIKKFSKPILNIHPSLLPKYKGLNTFKRALNDKEKITGCTVHFVDEKLDNGRFILKKRVGNASKGIKIINSEKEKKHIKINKNFILQEYLSGNDYTSGVYIDKKNKIYQVILKRNLMNGCTNECWLVNNKNISKQIIKIAKKLNFKYINIQFKVKNNKVYVYELNPRISGTTAFQSHVFNAPENYVRENEKKE